MKSNTFKLQQQLWNGIVNVHTGRVCVAQAVGGQHGPRLCGAPQGRAGELPASRRFSSSALQRQDPLPLPHWGTERSCDERFIDPLLNYNLTSPFNACDRNTAGKKWCTRRAFRQRYWTFMELLFLYVSYNHHIMFSWPPPLPPGCRQTPGWGLWVPPFGWETQISKLVFPKSHWKRLDINVFVQILT